MDAAVRERKREQRKFSMNDWITEAVREKMERGTEPTALETPTSGVRAAAPEKNVKNANGIGLDVGAFLAGKLGSGAIERQALLPPDEEELDPEDAMYLDKLNREFGAQKSLEAARVYKRTWVRMTPRQQYEMLCEAKERAS